jgi:hypothetical protein
MYISVSSFILVVWDIHLSQCFTSYSCSVWYSCISVFTSYTCSFLYSCISGVHQVYALPISNTTSITGETLGYMSIKHYKYDWWNIDIHEYQTLQVYLVNPWYTRILNTTSITGETLIFMSIKHYKYNWWIIDIHEYQTLQACISMFHQSYL